MNFEQPKFTESQSKYEPPASFSASVSLPIEPEKVEVFTAMDEDQDATVRGYLRNSEDGASIELAHEYPDFEPVGWSIAGPGLPDGTHIVGRDGRTLKLEVA